MQANTGQKDSANSRAPRPGRIPLIGALSNYFSSNRRAADFQPFMRDKMRTSTLDHLNRALELARKGNAEGARIHAELAENAMRTAGEYMSDDEYRRFTEEVERRLHPPGHANDPAPGG